MSFTVTLPANAGLSLDAAGAEGASCSVSGPTASCDFGAIAAGEQRGVSITARASLPGTVTARARVSASNDLMTSNNSRELGVSIRSGVDAAVTVTTDAAEVAVGAPLDIYAEVRSQRALPVRNAVLSLNLNQPVIAASMPGASCTANAFSVLCTIAEIAPGASLTLTVTANTAAAGPLFAAANVSASGDGDFTNNSANANAWVQAERDVELSAGPRWWTSRSAVPTKSPSWCARADPQATGDVALWVSSVSSAVMVDSIDAAGALCAQDPTVMALRAGLLAPGAARLVRLRVLGTRAGRRRHPCHGRGRQ